MHFEWQNLQCLALIWPHKWLPLARPIEHLMVHGLHQWQADSIPQRLHHQGAPSSAHNLCTANAAPCCKALAARPPCCSTSWIFSAIAAPPQQALGATSCCSTPTASPWGRQAVAAAVATCVGPMPPHTQALATLAPHVVTPLPVGLHRPTLWPPCPPPGGPGCPKGQARRAVLLAGAQGGALLAFWPPGGGAGGAVLA